MNADKNIQYLLMTCKSTRLCWTKEIFNRSQDWTGELDKRIVSLNWKSMHVLPIWTLRLAGIKGISTQASQFNKIINSTILKIKFTIYLKFTLCLSIACILDSIWGVFEGFVSIVQARSETIQRRKKSDKLKSCIVSKILIRDRYPNVIFDNLDFFKFS